MADSVLTPASSRRGRRSTASSSNGRQAVHARRVLRRGVPLRPQHGPRQLRPQRRSRRGLGLRASRPGAQPVADAHRPPAQLPPALEIDWKRFFAMSPTVPERSMLIDPFLSRSLRHVPPTGRPLAALNLDRGGGAEVAGRACRGREDGRAGAERRGAAGPGAEVREAAATAAPGVGRRSGITCCARPSRRPAPTGCGSDRSAARIVAEVLVGLLKGDETRIF